MAKPGLVFVASKITDPQMSEDLYNKLYNEEHLPGVLNYKPKVGRLALRYKNTNPQSEMPFIALYDVDDSEFFTNGGFEKLVADTSTSSKILHGQNVHDRVHFTPRKYEKIQNFEGQGNETLSGKDRGQTLVCVAMEPAEDGHQDFDEWYRKQHLDMLNMCRGYRRTTRYRRIDGVRPSYLALHEYACEPEDVPSDQIKMVVNTEWSKKIISTAQTFDRDVFYLIQAQGDEDAKL